MRVLPFFIAQEGSMNSPIIIKKHSRQEGQGIYSCGETGYCILESLR